LPNVLENKHPDCIYFFNNFIKILEKNKGIKKVVISGYFNSYFYKPLFESDMIYDDYGYNYFQIIDKSKMSLYESFQKHNAFIDFKTKLKKYKKGGVIDFDKVARIIVKDWNDGKLKYFTFPPNMSNEMTEVQMN
jgi:ribosome biogenesis GTPase A